MQDELGAERAQEHIGEVVSVDSRAAVLQELAHVYVVGGVDAVEQALAGCAVFGGRQQVALDLDVVEHALAEGHQALARGCPWPEWWETSYEVLLKAPLALVEQGAHKTAAIAEMAKQRALAHPRRERDLIHRHGVGSTGGDEVLGRVQDRETVACGVRPPRAGPAEHRQHPGQGLLLHVGESTFDQLRTAVHLC